MAPSRYRLVTLEGLRVSRFLVRPEGERFEGSLKLTENV
jgi:hypothetical protein